jgi:hypothetical protein
MFINKIIVSFVVSREQFPYLRQKLPHIHPILYVNKLSIYCFCNVYNCTIHNFLGKSCSIQLFFCFFEALVSSLVVISIRMCHALQLFLDKMSLLKVKRMRGNSFVKRFGEDAIGCLDPSGGLIMADKALRTVQVKFFL